MDYQPGKFFWQETVRPKYVRREQRALPPVIAAAPQRVAEHSLAAPGLLAQLLVSKYCDHLPFYRQEQIFWQRHGVFIARQQMVQWTAQSVRLLSGISDCLKRQMQGSPYVQVDETPVRYQDPNLRGRCGQGYLWTALVPGQCVVYEWHTSRAARCLDSLLGPGFAGKLQCDGYSAYPAFAKGKSAVDLLGCWAHARRNFFEAQEQAPRVAGWFLNQIGLLYRWEEELRRNRAGPVLRQVQRSSHHRMVIERLGRALKKLQPRYLPQSLMGQAIGYALNQWPMLEGFLEHGEVGDRQQLGRERHSAHSPGQEELAVLRFGRSRPAQRRDLHADRKLPAARRRALHLSQRRAGTATTHHQSGSRPINAVRVEADPPGRPQTGCLKLPRRQANRSLYHGPLVRTGGRSNPAYRQELNRLPELHGYKSQQRTAPCNSSND